MLHGFGAFLRSNEVVQIYLVSQKTHFLMDIFLPTFRWVFFYQLFVGYFSANFLLDIFLSTFCWIFVYQLFVGYFSTNFLLYIFCPLFLAFLGNFGL